MVPRGRPAESTTSTRFFRPGFDTVSEAPPLASSKRATFSASQKLEILQYMWVNQLSYMQAAAHFNIRSPGVIPGWERCYHSDGINALAPRQRGRPKKMPDLPPPKQKLPIDDDTRTREELLAEVNHLRMENAYLKKLKALVQQQQAVAPKKRR